MKGLRDVLVTCLYLTGLTQLAVYLLGAHWLLPAIFVERYARLGKVARSEIRQYAQRCRSTRDEQWTAYWDDIAAATAHSTCLQELRRSLTYYSISAFSGATTCRLRSYRLGVEVFERMIDIINRSTEYRHTVQSYDIDSDEPVHGYLMLPRGRNAKNSGGSPLPVLLFTNGLEGQASEIVLPLLDVLPANAAAYVMEMPGTYQYSKPFTYNSIDTYYDVVQHLAHLPAIDSARCAMVGISFGGYCAARVAADSRFHKHVKCVVSSGPPITHTFGYRVTDLVQMLGIPPLIIDALQKITHTTNLLSLLLSLRQLSFERHNLYEKIAVPLLVINGEHDTLVSQQDTMDLAIHARTAVLKLYANADHCAVEAFDDMFSFANQWVAQQLKIDTTE